jgi:hypothetical protein
VVLKNLTVPVVMVGKPSPLACGRVRRASSVASGVPVAANGLVMRGKLKA